jgi:ABC-type uncharacterized transport system ATPase subunit
MTLVTETVPETEKVEWQKTEVDFETVTKEVEKVKCDCCEQRWEKDGRVETREIVVNPTATATVQQHIEREQQAFETHGFPHENQGSLHDALNQIVEGFEIRVPNPEHRASDLSHRNEQDGKNVCSTLAEAEQRLRDRATSMGKIPRYHHVYGFHVELPVQGDTKHLCEYCYEVIFNA